jgi:hypothetical protein
MAMKVIWDRYNPQTKRNQRILRRACVKEETQKRSKAFSQEIEGYKST